jgi:hypothetical protein
VDWSGGDSARYAIHLALLPGDGSPYFARILWWRGEAPGGFKAGLWGWRAGCEGCNLYPSANFTDLSPVADPGMNPFCGGQSGLEDGRLLIVGGHDSVMTDYGERRTRIFSAGSCSMPALWSDPGVMSQWRWYCVATPLRDGRVIALGGQTFPSFRLFGGRHNGIVRVSPEGDSLYRFLSVPGGRWGPAMIPDIVQGGSRPTSREGLSAAEMDAASGFWGQVFFGGRDTLGPKNDTWLLTRDNNVTGPDFRFTWVDISQTGAAPLRRSEHSVVGMPADTMMVLFGGLNASGNGLADVWRLHWDPGHGITWSNVETFDTGPTARFGQAALYDASDPLKRMIVFGGTDSLGKTPTDLALWELRFDRASKNEATWRQVLVEGTGPAPAPRYGHRMALDPLDREDPGDSLKLSHAALLYGGALGGGAFSDTLWLLWLHTDGTARWEARPVGGTSGQVPGGRARHSLGYDPGHGDGAPGGRLYVFGGRDRHRPGRRQGLHGGRLGRRRQSGLDAVGGCGPDAHRPGHAA